MYISVLKFVVVIHPPITRGAGACFNMIIYDHSLSIRPAGKLTNSREKRAKNEIKWKRRAAAEWKNKKSESDKKNYAQTGTEHMAK